MPYSEKRLKAGRIVVGLLAGLICSPVSLASSSVVIKGDEGLTDGGVLIRYIKNVCFINAAEVKPGSELATFCINNAPLAFVSDSGSQALSSSQNLSIANTRSPVSSPVQKAKQELNEDNSGLGGSAEFQLGNLGMTIGLNHVQTDRVKTQRESGYDSSTNTALISFDYEVNRNLIVGLAGNISRVNTDIDNNGGNMDMDTKGLSLLASYASEAGLYLGAYAGFVNIDSDSTRNINAAGTTSIAKGNNDGSTNMFGVSASYDVLFDSVTFSPYVNWDYSRTKMNDFTESGGGGLAMIFNDQVTTSNISSVGFRIMPVSGFSQGKVFPEFRLSWQHEFNDDSKFTQSAFKDAPGVSLLTKTDEPDRNYFTAGLGAVFAMDSDVTMFIDYEKRFGHSLFDSWSATAGLQVSF